MPVHLKENTQTGHLSPLGITTKGLALEAQPRPSPLRPAQPSSAWIRPARSQPGLAPPSPAKLFLKIWIRQNKKIKSQSFPPLTHQIKHSKLHCQGGNRNPSAVSLLWPNTAFHLGNARSSVEWEHAFPDMPRMKRVYIDKKASFHWSAARNKERFSSR